MLEAPHFLRLTRALALGALAAPALHCTPSATVAQPAPNARADSEPRARSPRPPQDAPVNNGTATALADGVPRTGNVCTAGGTMDYRAEGRTLIACQCQIPAEQDDATPSRWICSTHERASVGLDGQACEQLDATRPDEGNPSAGSRCVCVANGDRREYACYLAFNVMAGPLAPPDWARETLS